MHYYYDCFLFEELGIETDAQKKKFNDDAQYCADLLEKAPLITVTIVHIIVTEASEPDRYIRLNWKKGKHNDMPFAELQSHDEISLDRMLDMINTCTKVENIKVYFNHLFKDHA